MECYPGSDAGSPALCGAAQLEAGTRPLDTGDQRLECGECECAHAHARTHTHTVLYEVITASSPCVFTLKQVHVCVCPVCLSGHPSCLLRHSAGVHSQDAIPAGNPATAHGHRWGQDREEALLGPAALPPGVLSPGITGERRVRHCRDVCSRSVRSNLPLVVVAGEVFSVEHWPLPSHFPCTV